MGKPDHGKEDSLLEKAVHHDKTAFTCLYDKYVDQIYRHVYYRISEQTVVEDITQEVFIKAWKAIPKYRKTGAPFIAWLTTIAHNLIVDHYKSKKKHVSLEDIDLPASNIESDPVAQTEVNFNKNRVRHAISNLRDEKQRVILMRFVDGFSYREIARVMNKSEGAVRVIQYRALNDLRGLLAR